MTDFLSITCPHCGEQFDVPVDSTDGSVEFVTDCEVCCRPMTIKLQIVDGEVESQDVSGE